MYTYAKNSFTSTVTWSSLNTLILRLFIKDELTNLSIFLLKKFFTRILKMKYYVFLISVCLTFLFINLGTASNRLDCNRRTFDDNSFVCVCNASYCDTIEQVDRDQSGQYFQEFVTSKTAHRLEKFKHPFEVLISSKRK